MKIVNLISVEQKTVVMGSSNIGTFFLDTAEEYGVEEGDVIIARGVNELYFGIAHLETYSIGSVWTLRDVSMSFYFCNVK
jgi:hypothetical protein